MPADFDKCVANGGKVRTISGKNHQHNIPEGHYMHICWLNGKSYAGKVKKKKT